MSEPKDDARNSGEMRCSSPLEILEAKWTEMQPGRYQTMIEDEVDESWMNGFRYAIDYLKERLVGEAHLEVR